MTTIYQFKITILDTPIWRRFRVYSDITFDDLHETIQIVMGWENYHLYEFSIGVPSSKLVDCIQREGGWFTYHYDFGDDWMHELVLEKILSKTKQLLPYCTAGRKACPPEDIGGVWGYHDLILGMKQGRGRRYNEWRRQLGERFDPSAFDRYEVNQLLAERFESRPGCPQGALFTGPRCPMCEKPIVTKPRAGKPRQYCSNACKQAAYRQKRAGINIQNRKLGRAVGNVQGRDNEPPKCAFSECDNPTISGKRSQWMMYCSDSCKQKAKRRMRRQRALEATASQPQVLPSELEPQRFSKGRGVVHYSVDGMSTFCGRDVANMEEYSNSQGRDICKRCQDVRENQTWWTYRM